MAKKSEAQLLLVDGGVDERNVLLAGLEPGFTPVALTGSDVGGLEAISRALAGYTQIDSLHILSHGAPGSVALTAGPIDASSLLSRPDLVARIAERLSEDAEVVLYGCSVASGQSGEEFVDLFSRMLGRQVEAAQGPVGSSAHGASWEFLSAPRLAFDEPARNAFPGVLVVATFGVVTTLNTTTTLTSNEIDVTVSATRSDGVAMAGVSSGFLDAGVIANTTTYTLNFSAAIHITQFQIGEFSNLTTGSNYSFTPDAGTAVTLADNSGSIVGAIATLNPGDWTNVTSFTVSYAGATDWRVGLDNINYTLVATTPSTLGTPDLLAASDTGVSSTDNITNSTTQQLSGSATTGETVSILVGGTTVNTVTAVGGSWSYTHTLTAGSYAITALATNGNGAGPSSTTLNIVVDTTAPVTLTPPDLLAASDTGTSSTDNITSATTQQLSGSATTGDIVSILVGGVTANVVTAVGGSWSYTHTLTAGSYAITVQATDVAGNAGPASSALGIVIDTTAPTTLEPADLLAASDTGTSSTDNITSSATQQLSGSATTGDIVSILVGGVTASTVVAAGGSWSYTHTLTTGSYAITVLASDTAGNAGAASSALGVVVDTTAPTTLATPDLLAASDTGTSNTDNNTSSTTQQLSGSATTGDTVSILVGGTTVNTVTATGGSWSYTHTLTAGSYAVTVQAADTAGNAGPASTALGLVVDTTAPTTLEPADLLAVSDLGLSTTDNITSSATQQLSGSASTGDIVSIIVGGTTANVVTAVGGSWSYTHTLTAGSYAVTVQATDTAGNAGPASSALGIVIDTTAPGTAGPADLLASSDLGTSSTDNITSSVLPTFSGTGAVANSLVHLLVGGVTVGSITASAAGAWTFTATATLTAGTQLVTVRAEDVAGNDGPASVALNVVIDTTAPAAPGTLATPDLIAASDTGTSNTDNNTTDTTPSFVGTNTTGSAVHALVANGATVGTFTSDAGGTFSVTSSSLATGSYAIGIQELDAAGNASATSPTLSIVISAPASTGGNSGGGDSGGGGGGSSSSTPTITQTTTGTSTSTSSSGSTVTSTTQVITNSGTISGTAAIVENTGNNNNVVTATLPAATSITSEGPSTAQTASEALTTLVSAVDARDSNSESTLISGAQTFLNKLSSTTTLDVRTIIPTSTSTSLVDPIVITGTSASDGSTQSEAFVIDLRTINSSSGGITLQLDNIEFASVMGQATVTGGTGENYAVADDSAQFISLGEGDDTLFGGAGNDTVGSGSGADSLAGEEGDDVVFGGTDNDTVLGGADADAVYGNQNDDVLYGNQSLDTLYGGQDNDAAFGGQDADVIYGNLGTDSLSGQLGDDTIYGGQGDDLIYGGDGNDVLFGNNANDILSGGEGDDTIFGSSDFDVLYGGFGDDNLDGGSGDDTLYGGADGGANLLDVLNGGDGNDALYGGEGVDWIYTGSGSDAIYIEALNGFDVVTDFDSASGDVIHIATDVNGSGISSFADVQNAAANNADGNVEIALGSNNFVRLIGVSSDQLTSEMFQFF